MKKVLSIGKLNSDEKGIDFTRELTGNQRVSMLEDLRRQISKVTQHEYPKRFRKVLEIAHRATS